MVWRIGLSVALVLASAAPAAAAWEPWDDPGAQALPAEAYHAPESAAASGQPLHLLLRAYQVVFSAQDVGACPMYPSCSRFAMVAIRDYGPLQGGLMTASRLMRENGAIGDRHRHVRVGDRRLLRDMPEDHRLW